MKKRNWPLPIVNLGIIVYIAYKQPNFNFLSQVCLNFPSINRVQKNSERNRKESYLLVSQISSNQSFYKTSITANKYINEINASFEQLINQIDENTLGNIPDYEEERQNRKKMRRDKVYQKYKTRKRIRTLFDLPPLDENY